MSLNDFEKTAIKTVENTATDKITVNNKLSMSFNAKEFIPKTIKLLESEKTDITIKKDVKIDKDTIYSDLGYESHLNEGEVVPGEDICTVGAPNRPRSLQVAPLELYRPQGLLCPPELPTLSYSALYGPSVSHNASYGLPGDSGTEYAAPFLHSAPPPPSTVLLQHPAASVALPGTYTASTCSSNSPHSSYHSVSPPIIAASAAPPGNSSNSNNSNTIGEHYVMVHVNLGETFSIRVGDQIQNISGPATVRMVSNSGPPTPMPMQVPPGHMVQQIVDENGILTHVILSPLHQPTQCLAPQVSHMHPSNHTSSFYPSNQNNVSSLPVFPVNYNMYNNGTNISQSQNASSLQGVIVTNNKNIDPGSTEHNNKSRIDRLSKKKSNYSEYNTSHNDMSSLNKYTESKPRLMKSKGHQYNHPSQIDECNHYLKPRTSQMVSSVGTDEITENSNNHQDKSLNNSYSTHYSKIRKRRPFTNSASANTKHLYLQDQTSSPASSADEETTILTDEEKKAIRDVLNTVEIPKVSEIEARSALIHIIAPTVPDNCMASINLSDLKFQLHFAERNPDSRYNCVFYGQALEILLQDLKPATIYYVKVCCIYSSITGNLSPANKFTTSAAEPSTPKPVQLQAKTKNSVQIKWISPIENGSKITEYIVEYCRADSNVENYICGYRGNAKLCKVLKLKPSTEYLFRLAAINSHGQSAWSESLPITTSGTAPLPPDPPTIARADIGGLLLTWKKRPIDETFCLEMMDEATGYGFITVFNGPEIEHYVENLRRNTSYRFHLAASNQDGRSKWSEVVTISTKPDLPSPPLKLHVRGKINPTQFVLAWDPPEDDGGLPITSYKLEMDITTGEVTENDSDRDWVLFYEGLEHEHQCKSLVPGSLVLARVCARSSNGGWGPYCAPITVHLVATPPCQMSPPRKDIGNKTKGGQFTPGSINLLWEKPENDGGASVTNFELCQWLLKTKSKVSHTSNMSSNVILEEYLEECEEQTVYNGTQLHCQISGLVPGAQYRYRIRASNKAGNGKWSSYLDATSGPSAPEGPSEAPIVSSRSANSVVVSWLPPIQANGSHIIEYRLEMKHKSDPNGEFQLIYNGHNMLYEVKNLLPDSCYKFRVQALNRAGPSPYSPVSEFMTPPSVPSQVTNVRTDSVTMNSIKLSWKEPVSHGSAVTNYLVEVTNCTPINTLSSDWFSNNHSHLLQDVFTLSSETTDKIVADLLPETNYKIRIQAINSVGSGQFSSILKVSTLSPPPAPPKLECLNVQSNSLKLRWHSEISARQYYINRLFGCIIPTDKSRNTNLAHTSNELAITQYQLQMSRQPDAGWSNVYTGSLLFHKLGKLLESTNYYFRIMASNEIGEGEFSDPYLIVTEKAAPPPVRAPKVTDMNMDSCFIEWPAIRSMNYDPIVYILQLLTISEKDCDYRQLWKNSIEVYRGSDTSCRLNNLSPGTEYLTRVCAVRLCSPSTIEPEKVHDSLVHLQKTIHELGKSEKISAKLKDNNSSPVTELLGAFSKSVTFTTTSTLQARSNNSNTPLVNNSPVNPDRTSQSTDIRKLHLLPPFVCRWLENIGPLSDNHYIAFILCIFTIGVIGLAYFLQSFL